MYRLMVLFNCWMCMYMTASGMCTGTYVIDPGVEGGGGMRRRSGSDRCSQVRAAIDTIKLITRRAS